MTFEVHIDHVDNITVTDPQLVQKLDEMKVQLTRMEALMQSNFDNLNASLDAANTSLTEVASDINGAVAEIAALKDQLANGLTPDQAAAVVQRMNDLTTGLAAAAAIIDPAVPPGG